MNDIEPLEYFYINFEIIKRFILKFKTPNDLYKASLKNPQPIIGYSG